MLRRKLWEIHFRGKLWQAHTSNSQNFIFEERFHEFRKTSKAELEMAGCYFERRLLKSRPISFNYNTRNLIEISRVSFSPRDSDEKNNPGLDKILNPNS